MTDVRRRLPAIGSLLELQAVRALEARAPRELVASAARRVVDAARRDPAAAPADDAAWAAAVGVALDATLERSLRPVVNATGVILHTNLGRAPLARAAIAAIDAVASGYSNLEYDVDAGERGSRHGHCARLLAERTGAEDALVVNNCASALVLALNTLADGREAIISRGELVEIGGSFRVPTIMAKSGARLIEVGTTNRTHRDDYAAALSPDTGAIVSVHRSNFVQQGFVAAVPPSELAGLAKGAGVPLIHDFGSGLMVDLAPWNLTGEPTAADAVRAGATVVVMSGDKLLGGPQAGVILGTGPAIAAMRENPLARALRVDKLTLAALEATLELYRDGARAVREIPVLRMLTEPADQIRSRAERLAAALATRGVGAGVVRSDATVGGGAFPASRIPSYAVRLTGPASHDADARLRKGATAIVGRVIDDRLALDLRTCDPAGDDALAALIAAAVAP